nr:retrovirus-related Pol polyprotein from transposon TNT 1-94 [Tanacetum cinerariifolium]
RSICSYGYKVGEGQLESSEKAEEGSSKRAGSNLEKEDAKRQKIEEENESAELKRCLEIIPEDDDDVTIEATPLSSKSSTIVDIRFTKKGGKAILKSSEQMVSEQKDTTKGTSTNTKFANQSSERKPFLQYLRNKYVVRQPNAFQSECLNFSKTRVPQKVDKLNDLLNLVTSNSVPITKEPKVVENDIVIALGMFRINPFKNSREVKSVPNKSIKASVMTNSITVPQPHVITKKAANSDSNGFSSTGVDITTKTRRPQPRSNTKNDRVLSVSKSSRIKNKEVIQICLWCVNSSCSKHMTGNLKLLINYVWKFLGTIRFGNDHVTVILGFSNLQWGNILITKVYFVEGLGHNMFSIGKFCDSDLEVAFRRNTCFIRNLEGVDLLKGNRTTNLYTINIHDMASTYTICLMARATSTKLWLWHQRLSHLNFGIINDLARNDLVADIPKFKYHKGHLCPFCKQGKSKRASHPCKPVPNSKQMLHLLHIDLCGPMRIASINRKWYILVIVDDYSRYSWEIFLRSKDKAPQEIKTFLKKITVLLQASVIIDIGKLGAKGQISLGLGLTYALSTITTQRPTEGELNLLFEAMYDDHIGGQSSAAPRTVLTAQAPQNGSYQDFLAYVAHKYFNVFQMDVKTAFLHGTYGLKQAPMASYDELSTFLLQNHLLKGTIDPTLFISCFDDDILVVKVYVDDIIFRSTHPRMKSGDLVDTPMEIKDKLGLDQNGSPADDSGFKLTRFSDADYLGCKDTFKSTSGGAQFLCEKLLAGPQRNKTIRRCQTQKQNMRLYPLVVPKSFGCGHS